MDSSEIKERCFSVPRYFRFYDDNYKINTGEATRTEPARELAVGHGAASRVINLPPGCIRMQSALVVGRCSFRILFNSN